MRELLEVIDQLEKDLGEVLDEMASTTENTGTLMDRAGQLDWEIRIRTDALLNILRGQYASTPTT